MSLETLLNTPGQSTSAVSLTLTPGMFKEKEMRRVVALLLVRELTGGVISPDEEGQDAVMTFAKRVEGFLEGGFFSRI